MYWKLPDGSEIGLSFDDLLSAVKLLYRSGTPHLIYDTDKIRSFYSNTRDWLEYDGPSGTVVAPYQLVADFRKGNAPKGWGSVKCVEPYQFPLVLEEHRAKMVAMFESAKKLPKGNRQSPRVKSFRFDESNILELTVQLAMYYDQVGTNLTLDQPFGSSFSSGIGIAKCVREWDMAHSSCPGVVPDLENSQLANTVGVAVGVTALDQFGQRQILKRLRDKKVAVYENQWHIPFSFALAWPDDLEPGESISISDFIRRDYGHELAEELPGIEPTDFESPRIIAFCRDMVRGGKPQFFFEIRSRLSINELQARIRSDGAEFRNKTDIVDGVGPSLSTELLAFGVLVGIPAKTVAS